MKFIHPIVKVGPNFFYTFILLVSILLGFKHANAQPVNDEFRNTLIELILKSESDAIIMTKVLDIMDSLYLKKEDSVIFIASDILIDQELSNRLQGIGYYYKGLKMTSHEEEARSAYSNLKNSLDLLDVIKDENMIAYANHWISKISIDLGRYQQAIYYAVQTIEPFYKIKKYELYIQAHHTIGHAYHLMASYKEAIYYYEKAIRLSKELDIPVQATFSLSNLGNVYGELNNPARKLDLQLQAIKIHEEKNPGGDFATELYNVGLHYLDIGEFDRSMDYLKRGLDISIKRNIRHNEAVGYANIGEWYLKKGDTKKALEYANKGLEVRIASDDERELASSYAEIGKIYAINRNYQLAIDNYQNALRYNIKHNDNRRIKWNLLELGKLFDREGQYTKSQEALEEAHNLSIEFSDLETLTQAAELLSEVYAKAENYKKAYYYSFEAGIGKDSLNNREMIRELTSVQLQSEFAQEKNQLLASQEKEELILQNKIKQKNLLQYAFLAIGILFLFLFIVFYRSNKRSQRDNAIISSQKQRLEQSNVELKELLTFKKGMTNMIAHDIKNPLNSIISLSKALDKKTGTHISRAGEAILRLITNMLDVERFEQAKPVLNLNQVKLSDLIEEASLAVELLLYDKSIALDVQINHDASLSVDKEMILRVIINLLSNAIKFSPSNDTITIYSGISEMKDQKFIKVSISDNGPGIPKKDQPFIFNKFYQSEAKKSGLLPSTGLGLTFCKMAISAHNGTIEVDSEKGQGSTFTIVLAINEIIEESISQNGQLSLSLTEKEQQALGSYTSKLKELKIYNVGAITKILNEIDELNLAAEWLNHVKSAVQYSNEDQFNSLLDMIQSK